MENVKREKIDRVPISRNSAVIIKNTVESINEKYPEVAINKNGFVNWLIEDYFEKLTTATEKMIYEKFYDDVKFLEKSLRELKKRKKKGEEVSISEVLKHASPRFKKDYRKKVPKKVDEKRSEKPQLIDSSKKVG